MADGIQQQLKALATATEMGWMTKEDAGKEFKRLYALLGAGTGGGGPPASTGSSPSTSLQQAAADKQTTAGSLKMQAAVGSNAFSQAVAGSSQNKKHNKPRWDAEDGGVNLAEVLVHSEGAWKGTPSVESIRAASWLLRRRYRSQPRMTKK